MYKTTKEKQEYRSGHNEAVLKTVWVKAHGGSNPSSCAKKGRSESPFFFLACRVGRNPELLGVRASHGNRGKRFLMKEVEWRRFGDSQNPSSCATQQGTPN